MAGIVLRHIPTVETRIKEREIKLTHCAAKEVSDFSIRSQRNLMYLS